MLPGLGSRDAVTADPGFDRAARKGAHSIQAGGLPSTRPLCTDTRRAVWQKRLLPPFRLTRS